MGGSVDVRDVALAHSLALQKEGAGGNRFIVNSASFSWQDICAYIVSSVQVIFFLRFLGQDGLSFKLTNTKPSFPALATYCGSGCPVNALREARVANIPEGYPAALDKSKYHTKDTTKAKQILGIDSWRSLQEMAADTVNSINARFPGSI